MSITTIEELLLLMQPYAPLKVDALQKMRRRVDHGLTTVGLKIHCLSSDGKELARIINAMGGRSATVDQHRYSHAKGITLVLPAVGNARAAILLIECMEVFGGYKLFNNPLIQIQVCSPCRLEPELASILAATFYLGSDLLRRYTLDDLATTFSTDTIHKKHRGRRLVLYDGDGDLDIGFDWWELDGDHRQILSELPFRDERTDILTCQTRVDVENVNLVATLLSHKQMLSYWEHLGAKFVDDVRALLDVHLLGHVLTIPWVHSAGGNPEEDTAFMMVLEEMMSYAFDEYHRLRKHQRAWWQKGAPVQSGILAEMRQLLQNYREQLVAESNRLSQEDA